MKPIEEAFAQVQQGIERYNRERDREPGHPWRHELLINDSNGLIDVEYRGDYELWFEDDSIGTVLEDLLRLLASNELAPRLRSFVHRTEAVIAANGTYSIVIDALLESGQIFPALAQLELDQGQGEHGYKILASARNGGDGFYDEAGVIADLLNAAPALLFRASG